MFVSVWKHAERLLVIWIAELFHWQLQIIRQNPQKTTVKFQTMLIFDKILARRFANFWHSQTWPAKGKKKSKRPRNLNDFSFLIALNMVFLAYKTYSFSLLFSSSTTSFSNYPLCWVISLWTNSWSPKIQEKKRWETTYMEITTMPQINITPTTLLMMVKFNRKRNFITQSEMKMYNQDKRITSSEGSDSALRRESNISLRKLKTCFR